MKPRILVRALLFLFLTAAFQGAAVPAAADSAKDGEITDKVRQRLFHDPDVKGYTVEVETKDGVVTLKGTVETERGRQRAEKVAKKVSGVKNVVNELRVDPPKPPKA